MGKWKGKPEVGKRRTVVNLDSRRRDDYSNYGYYPTNNEDRESSAEPQAGPQYYDGREAREGAPMLRDSRSQSPEDPDDDVETFDYSHGRVMPTLEREEDAADRAETPPLPEVSLPKDEPKDEVDEEVVNFLAEIEAISLPDEKAPDDATNSEPTPEVKSEEIKTLVKPATPWQQCKDQTTNCPYYWNTQTNEVTWQMPQQYTAYLFLLQHFEKKVQKFTEEDVKYEVIQAELPEAKADEKSSHRSKKSKHEKKHKHKSSKKDVKFVKASEPQAVQFVKASESRDGSKESSPQMEALVQEVMKADSPIAKVESPVPQVKSSLQLLQVGYDASDSEPEEEEPTNPDNNPDPTPANEVTDRNHGNTPDDLDELDDIDMALEVALEIKTQRPSGETDAQKPAPDLFSIPLPDIPLPDIQPQNYNINAFEIPLPDVEHVSDVKADVSQTKVEVARGGVVDKKEEDKISDKRSIDKSSTDKHRSDTSSSDKNKATPSKNTENKHALNKVSNKVDKKQVEKKQVDKKQVQTDINNKHKDESERSSSNIDGDFNKNWDKNTVQNRSNDNMNNGMNKNCEKNTVDDYKDTDYNVKDVKNSENTDTSDKNINDSKNTDGVQKLSMNEDASEESYNQKDNNLENSQDDDENSRDVERFEEFERDNLVENTEIQQRSEYDNRIELPKDTESQDGSLVQDTEFTLLKDDFPLEDEFPLETDEFQLEKEFEKSENGKGEIKMETEFERLKKLYESRKLEKQKEIDKLDYESYEFKKLDKVDEKVDKKHHKKKKKKEKKKEEKSKKKRHREKDSDSSEDYEDRLKKKKHRSKDDDYDDKKSRHKSKDDSKRGKKDDSVSKSKNRSKLDDDKTSKSKSLTDKKRRRSKSPVVKRYQRGDVREDVPDRKYSKYEEEDDDDEEDDEEIMKKYALVDEDFDDKIKDRLSKTEDNAEDKGEDHPEDHPEEFDDIEERLKRHWSKVSDNDKNDDKFKVKSGEVDRDIGDKNKYEKPSRSQSESDDNSYKNNSKKDKKNNLKQEDSLDGEKQEDYKDRNEDKKKRHNSGEDTSKQNRDFDTENDNLQDILEMAAALRSKTETEMKKSSDFEAQENDNQYSERGNKREDIDILDLNKFEQEFEQMKSENVDLKPGIVSEKRHLDKVSEHENFESITESQHSTKGDMFESAKPESNSSLSSKKSTPPKTEQDKLPKERDSSSKTKKPRKKSFRALLLKDSLYKDLPSEHADKDTKIHSFDKIDDESPDNVQDEKFETGTENIECSESGEKEELDVTPKSPDNQRRVVLRSPDVSESEYIPGISNTNVDSVTETGDVKADDDKQDVKNPDMELEVLAFMDEIESLATIRENALKSMIVEGDDLKRVDMELDDSQEGSQAKEDNSEKGEENMDLEEDDEDNVDDVVNNEEKTTEEVDNSVNSTDVKSDDYKKNEDSKINEDHPNDCDDKLKGEEHDDKKKHRKKKKDKRKRNQSNENIPDADLVFGCEPEPGVPTCENETESEIAIGCVNQPENQSQEESLTPTCENQASPIPTCVNEPAIIGCLNNPESQDGNNDEHSKTAVQNSDTSDNKKFSDNFDVSDSQPTFIGPVMMGDDDTHKKLDENPKHETKMEGIEGDIVEKSVKDGEEKKGLEKGVDVVEINGKSEKGVKDQQYEGHTEEYSEEMAQVMEEVSEMSSTILDKLAFLEVGKAGLSSLQTLLISIETRVTDWQSGGLDTSYFLECLRDASHQLTQYESLAAPQGWTCQWSRSHRRYFYANDQSGATQWDYPDDKPVTRKTTDTTTKSVIPTSNTTSAKSGGGAGDDGSDDDGAAPAFVTGLTSRGEVSGFGSHDEDVDGEKIQDLKDSVVVQEEIGPKLPADYDGVEVQIPGLDFQFSGVVAPPPPPSTDQPMNTLDSTHHDHTSETTPANSDMLNYYKNAKRSMNPDLYDSEYPPEISEYSTELSTVNLDPNVISKPAQISPSMESLRPSSPDGSFGSSGYTQIPGFDTKPKPPTTESLLIDSSGFHIDGDPLPPMLQPQSTHKKKKKEKPGFAGSSLSFKKKNVTSLVNKWRKIKDEVEREEVKEALEMDF